MRFALLALGLWICTTSAQAATLKTPAGNFLDWQLPIGWQAPEVPPTDLLEEVALHIGHEARIQGKNPSQSQLLKAAAQRLSANELLLYHPSSGAWISFDFSLLRKDEAAPEAKTLELSAGYALESLRNEEGVSDLQATQQDAQMASAPGTRRITTSYWHHDTRTGFNGLIGYLPGEWFFIYATSYPDKTVLRSQIDALFDSLQINP